MNAKDNLHVRLTFDLGKENKISDHHSSKEHLKISKIAKFCSQMLLNKKNIASRSWRILCTLVLRTEKVTIFVPICSCLNQDLV